MSGDVQPRKRKDKKRKREEEEIIHHGVHATKMGTEDVHLHVQSEHGTGGNWCAKIFFFSLMAILIGLVGLIIMENRGLSDLDTPLQESRFSEYFEGWVDEYREEHHDDHNIVAHEIEEHDLHDEPFEEVDENDSHGDVDDDDKEDEDDVGERHDTEEDDDDEENNITNEAEDPETAEDDDDADEDDETAEDDNNDTDDLNQDNDDENNIEASYTKINREAQLDHQPKLAQHQQKQDDDDENEIDDNESDDDEDDDDDKKNKEDDDPFDEEEYDGTFESLEENVVDNDAEELSLLRKKADQASKNSNAADSEENSSTPQIEPRTGGPQSYDNDDSIEEELKRAEEQMSQKNFKAGLKIYESLALKYPDYPKALYGKAIALDTISTIMESTDMLKQSIIAYQRYLALDELIPDEEFKNASYYCINQMRSINHYNSAISIHLALINRFDDDPKSRNELVITYLHLDRLSDAKALVEINLSRWPDNGVALVNYGYILLQSDSRKDLEKGVHYLQLGIETNEIGTQEQLFYSLLGLNLIRLDREHEGREIFRKAVAKKLFISEYQRPFLYNKNLKGQPFWTKNETGYTDLFNLFEYNWRKIRDEAVSVLTEKEYFENENANLTEFGNWKFFSLFTYGNKILKNCKKTPFTCALLEFFLPARHCTIGVIKFSVIHPGTHIKPHCGANNYRLRAHLGLVIPRDTTIRVVEEKRNWKEGEFLIFDDSFEHEVWHNGTSLRLILLIDVWHPQVTREEKILLKHAPTNFNSKWVSRLNRVE